MRNILGELKSSRFIRKEDVGDKAVIVTIKSIDKINVAGENEAPSNRWVIYFEKMTKPMVLNNTNGQAIAKIIGTEDADKWIGQKVVLYFDPNVTYKGKTSGGLRIRAPKKSGTPAKTAATPATPATPAAPASADKTEDDPSEWDLEEEGNEEEA